MADKKNNTGNWNTGNRNAGDWNTGNWNTGNWNTGYGNTGNWNTGNWNTGDLNTGNWNTGYGNSTNRESGIFNSEAGKIRMFNKPTDLTWDEIDHPRFDHFYLTKWIDKNDMTDEEKKEHSFYKTTEGYLKTYNYKEAWKNFWEKTDEENRQKFLNLPNFDSEVFKEITGIYVNKGNSDDKTQEAMELLKSKGYKIVKD